MTAAPPAISFDDVHQSYRGPADAVLRGVTLSVPRSEFCVILGRSGMGKSTLLRCVNGFVRPYQGTVTVAGTPVTKRKSVLREVRRRTGFIFQGYNLVNRLTVLQNVLCGMLPGMPWYRSVTGLFTGEQKERAVALLAEVGLAGFAGKRADQLSGGQKQRVGIARALAGEPEIILADEPVASLDPVTAEEILTLLSDINRSKGTTLVVSLHQLEYARTYGDRIVALLEGKLAIERRASELSTEDVSRIYGQSAPRAVLT
ncbi:phosphonate ABC transporter ATP-binding protein [Saccharomonospora sp. NPDC006951]